VHESSERSRVEPNPKVAAESELHRAGHPDLFTALATDGVQPSQRGSMMALYHGGFNAGIAAALLVGGGVTERFGYPTLFALSAAVTLGAALALARSELEPRVEAKSPLGEPPRRQAGQVKLKLLFHF
jgi:MFS family permease